jgi:Jumonji helical domain
VVDKSTIIHMLVNENETVIVPSGWIHGVYTSMDSTVFSGNFLHGYSAQMQIKINDMESRAAVEDNFRCPYFNISQVFAANMYANQLQLGKEKGENRNTILVKKIRELRYLVEYVESEYHRMITSRSTGGLEERHVVQQSKREKYNSVYDKPDFADAVKYVVSQQDCMTLKEFVRKLNGLMVEVPIEENP